MNVLILMIPLALMLSATFIFAFIWATRSGQWDDLDLTPLKMLDENPSKEGRKE